MIVFIEGVLDMKEPTMAVVQTGGVGYEVFIPLSCFDRLPAEGQRIRLHIYDHVREDDHLLYGFTTQDERRTFVLLLGVTGIGPRLALSLLSGLAPRELKAAVAAGDVKRLSQVQGIGKKTAERIVLELRDKVGPAELTGADSAPLPMDPASIIMRDAALALVALGYKRGEAETLIRKAVEGADGAATDVELLIRKALAR